MRIVVWKRNSTDYFATSLLTSQPFLNKIMNLKALVIVLIQLLCFCFCTSSDTITIDKSFQDGDPLLVSNAQNFALGFFSPGKSTNRYVGVWYHKLPEQTVVWVANRDSPVSDTSGVLSINPDGNLVGHHNYSNLPTWSTNVSLTHSNNTVIAQLLDTGNLVLIQNSTKTIIWQSFDHLTDSWIPYTKLSFNKRTGQSWFLQSWKTEDDPGSGNFTFKFDITGKAQLLLYNQNHQWWRAGSFNGEILVGIPFMKRAIIDTFNYSFVDNDNEVTFNYNMYDKSVIARIMVHQSGFLQVFIWDYQKNEWNRYWSAPEAQCDNYGSCGVNSNCDPLNYESFQCSCLPGFEPKNPHDWYQNKVASGGCVRKNLGSICGKGDGFLKVESVKIPDTSVATAKMDVSLEECEQECSRNCSCTAYTAADVRNGGSGCLAWHGTLMDTQKLSEEGRDLYVRVHAVELANYARKSKEKLAKKGVEASLAVSAAVLALLVVLFVWKKKKRDTMRLHINEDAPREKEHGESSGHSNLLFFHFKTITDATDNFASENKLGEGGFGSVYKGRLVGGQEIAVKRLSEDSGQGAPEFKNEIEVIAKLQHRNLVRLLGCCIHRKEKMLIYEYLPNKSLDFFIFDLNQRSSLDWDKRFEIIFGIARGVLYLHEDSRLKIIHRDLKASNILLDATMNPKISDFGMAKIFGKDQIQARTRRLVGTFGYMSPEYAMEGHYSTKSDVFSFGVLLLEIIAGKRNIDREQGRAALNLIGHVWDSWREGSTLDIVDSTLGQSYPAAMVLRCVQIGLLCVQESAMERPSMLDVVLMLGNETTLPSPQRPAFIFSGNQGLGELSTSLAEEYGSVNEVTTTSVSAR